MADVREYHWENSYSDLSSLERKRAREFAFQVHRSRYIRARSIVRAVLAVYQPREVLGNYAVGTYGKPFVRDSRFHFNISHSSESLAIAVSLADVGMDIERKRPVVTEQLAMACMSRSERANLTRMSAPAALEYFFKVWTAKEALLKAAGIGLHIDMKQISLTISHDIRIASLPTRLGSASDWSISPIRLADDTAAALATSFPLNEVRIFQCHAGAASIDVDHIEEISLA